MRRKKSSDEIEFKKSNSRITIKNEYYVQLVHQFLKQKGSLSQVLKNTSEIKDKLRNEFPKPYNAKRPKIIKAEPLTKNYAKVGIAFGYLLNFIIKRLNPNVVDLESAAESSLEILNLIHPEYLNQAETIINKIKELKINYVKTGKINNELLKYTLLISRLDRYVHSGIFSENLEKYDKKDIEDLKNLINAVDLELFKTDKICILNPRFGNEIIDSNIKNILKRSFEDLKLDTLEKHLPGAEPDLIIDDIMIDVKTTKSPKFEREYLNQLLGYYTYYKLFGLKVYPSDNRIKRIGIYFSRYGHLSEYFVKDLINEESFPKFCIWFIKKIYIN
jgi:hypothetical protein